MLTKEQVEQRFQTATAIQPKYYHPTKTDEQREEQQLLVQEALKFFSQQGCRTLALA